MSNGFMNAVGYGLDPLDGKPVVNVTREEQIVINNGKNYS
jgi:hypothetical protein